MAFSRSGLYKSQLTKFVITRMSLRTPNTSTVCRRKYSLIDVMPSDFSMEYLVIGKYDRSAPTNVMSVPCSVVMKGKRRTPASMSFASIAEIECGMRSEERRVGKEC